MKVRTKIEDYDIDDNEAHEKLLAPADWTGPIDKGRFCTDILCFGLIIISWILMTIIGIYASQNGDYRYTVYPLDYDGNVCGTDNQFQQSTLENEIKPPPKDMTNFPYLYYINYFTGGVCVNQCPSLHGKVSDNLTDIYTLITYNGIWQPTTTTSNNNNNKLAELDFSNINDNDETIFQVADYTNATYPLTCTNDICYPNNDPIQSWSSIGIAKGFGFAYYIGDSYDVLNRCFLTEDAENRISQLTNSSSVGNIFLSYTSIRQFIPEEYNIEEFWSNIYSDLWETKNYILGLGFGLSIGISLFYMMMLRIPFLLTSIVWVSIFSTIGLIGFAGYYSYSKAEEWSNDINDVTDTISETPIVGESISNSTTITTIQDNTVTYLTWAAYILWIIALILFIIACCLRKQIQLAIGCVKEAGKAINSMVLILVVPIIQAIGLILFVIIWGYYSIQLASMGTITIEKFPVGGGISSNINTQIDAIDNITMNRPHEIAVRYYTFDDFIKQCGWYLLFCLYWTSQFIIAIGDIIIALAISKWYFSPNKRNRASSITVIKSITTTIFFHLGTAAYGSLIIATIQLIRTIIAKIQKEVEKLTNNSKLVGIILCCCQCCFCCLEHCMKFINKNAYIQTAIFGTSFCKSARKAFFLILRNISRIGAVSYVSWAVLFIGKLFISSLTTIVSYYILLEHSNDIVVTSYIGPIILIFFLSYVISDMFMDVYEISIVAILHCFIADEEMFHGTARYANTELSNWIDRNGGL